MIGEYDFVSNYQQEPLKEVLVFDGSSIYTDFGIFQKKYKYIIKEKKWKEEKIRKDYCSGEKLMFELDEVLYVVYGSLILNLSQNKLFLELPTDLKRNFHKTCLFKDQLIFFSGSNEVKSRMFDIKHKSWKDLSIKLLHQQVSAIEYLDKVWLTGGIKDYTNVYKPLDSVEVYDPITDEKTSSPIKMMQARYEHKAVVFRKKLFIFGGRGESTKLNTVEMFSPIANKFVMMAPMKITRSWFGCCRANNLVYIVGGRDEETVFNSVEVYDLENNTWSKGADLPCGAECVVTCAVTN